jgi:predicted nucleic acid-binding Zn ribbon protein
VDGIQITVEKASGSKCERCYNYSEAVGRFSDEPTICERCYAIIRDGVTSGKLAWDSNGYYWTDMRPHCDDYDHLPMPEYPDYWRQKYDYPPQPRDLSEYDRAYLKAMDSNLVQSGNG